MYISIISSRIDEEVANGQLSLFCFQGGKYHLISWHYDKYSNMIKPFLNTILLYSALKEKLC